MGLGHDVVATEAKEEEGGIAMARRNSMRQQKRHYPYVILGAGTSAHAAIEAILQHEPTADILILLTKQHCHAWICSTKQLRKCLTT